MKLGNYKKISKKCYDEYIKCTKKCHLKYVHHALLCVYALYKYSVYYCIIYF